jgi:hypothetical protein
MSTSTTIPASVVCHNSSFPYISDNFQQPVNKNPARPEAVIRLLEDAYNHQHHCHLIRDFAHSLVQEVEKQFGVADRNVYEADLQMERLLLVLGDLGYQIPQPVATRQRSMVHISQSQ